MPRSFHPLLKILATVSSHRKLATQLQFLKVENDILRSRLPKRVMVTPAERMRLMKFGLKVGPAIRELITIVSPRTFARWLNGAKEPSGTPRKPVRKPGRPRTSEDVRAMVIELARQVGGGYTRILGELKKLGITKICRTTVRNIMIEEGVDPDPRQGEGSWDEFLKMYAKTLWACDFLSKKVWTLQGLVCYYLLFFIHIQTREVVVTSCTNQPGAAWVEQQARNVMMAVEDSGRVMTDLLHDWDTKFTKQFDAIVKSGGARVHRVGPSKPNLNAYAERFAQTLQVECLDHFVVLGPKHLDHLVSEFVEHYHQERPHQAWATRRRVGWFQWDTVRSCAKNSNASAQSEQEPSAHEIHLGSVSHHRCMLRGSKTA